jgi:DNA transformation protein and related proteins
MPKAPDPLAEYIVDQLRDWAPVTVRRLFGGSGIYNGPIMFGLIARETIYFRVDDDNRPDYVAAATGPFVHTARRRTGEAAPGPKPFQYQMPNGKIMEMAYYEVPPDVLEDPETLARWAAKAHRAALKIARDKAAKKAKTGAKAHAKPATAKPAAAKQKR